MMAKLRCENVTRGLRDSEVVAAFSDYSGRRHFIRVEGDFLYKEPDGRYLPVGIVHIDPKTRLVLIELPQEAETGANRLWVREEQLGEPVEVYA